MLNKLFKLCSPAHTHRTRHRYKYSLCVLISLLIVGCAEDVTITSINEQKTELRRALTRLGDQASNSNQETISAYEQLRDFLREEKLSDRRLRSLEQRLERVTRSYESLQSQLSDTEEAGEDLFSMLEERAKENRTRKFRKQLLNKIDENQDLLEERLEDAEEVMKTLGQSVQKYDDIVGYLQVNQGLGGVSGILDDVQRVMDDSADIDVQIRKHIEEGMQVVESL